MFISEPHTSTHAESKYTSDFEPFFGELQMTPNRWHSAIILSEKPAISQLVNQYIGKTSPPDNVGVLTGDNPPHLAKAHQQTHTHSQKGEEALTLHPPTIPSPPAQTMLVLTAIPHQSRREQVAWSATGISACCRLSAMGPPAETQRQKCLT